MTGAVEHFLYIQKPPAKPRNPGRSGYCSTMTAYVLEAVKATMRRNGALSYTDVESADVRALIDSGFCYGDICADHSPARGFRRSAITGQFFHYYEAGEKKTKPLGKLNQLISQCKKRLHSGRKIIYPRFKVTGNPHDLIAL